MASEQSVAISQLRGYRFFDQLEAGISNHELIFRLVHFWEARNSANPDVLYGLDLLLIDEKGVVIKGFISPNRISRFQPILKRNSVYIIDDFYVAPNNDVLSVSEQAFIVCFTDLSTLTAVHDGASSIPEDRFRFQSFEDFKWQSDKNGSLYDVIGEMKLIDGHLPSEVQNLFGRNQNPRETDRAVVAVHLQLQEGNIVNVYLSDIVAIEFLKKIHTSGATPSMLLLTTVHPKRDAGRVSLHTTVSTRVFVDNEVATRRQYLTGSEKFTRRALSTYCLSDSVTKIETLNLGDIHHYLKNKRPQAARFWCSAQIVEVIMDHGWYYFSCSTCTKKLNESATSMVCNLCNNQNAKGHIRYRLEVRVRDETNNSFTFILFDRVATELLGIHATDLVKPYLNGHGSDGSRLEIPIPAIVLDTIGQTYKFEVKVTESNFQQTAPFLIVSHIIARPMLPYIEAEAFLAGHQSGGSSSITANAKNGR